jgi:anti-anti-sigma factor
LQARLPTAVNAFRGRITHPDQVAGGAWVFSDRMGFADRNRHYWTARWEGGISIDDLVDAFVGGGTVYADKQLVVARTLDPVGLRFSGEIDINNCGAVATCLNAIAADEVDVHLDISSLLFCDISGIRAFVEAAQRREKGRLVLHGLPELLQTVMRVTGWADLPSLNVCDCKAGSR